MSQTQTTNCCDFPAWDIAQDKECGLMVRLSEIPETLADLLMMIWIIQCHSKLLQSVCAISPFIIVLVEVLLI